MRSIIILLIATTCLLQAKITRAPYLQLATDNAIHIVWRTDTPISPQIKFGQKVDQLDLTSSSDHIITRQTATDGAELKSAPLHSAPKGTYQFKAKLTGLKTDTLYHYAVYDGDNRLTADDGTYTFRTHPIPGTQRDLYFWAVGDSGTGSIYQKKVF